MPSVVNDIQLLRNITSNKILQCEGFSRTLFKSSNVLFKIPWLSKILNPLHIFEVIIENICKLLVPLLSENPNAPEDEIYGGRTPLPFKIDFAFLDF